MKGLLLKDIYTLTKQLKLFLVLIVVFAVWPGFSMAGFAICYSTMLPITALAYDERSKWNKLAATMPYSAEDMVLSKFVLGYICIGCSAAISLISRVIYSTVKSGAISPEIFWETLCFVFVGLIFAAINMPVMIRFGVEKGRLIFFAMIFIAAIAAMLFSSNFAVTAVNFPPALIILILFGSSVAANIISMGLSQKYYKKQLEL